MSGNFLMDFAGPADVFGNANQFRDIYEVVFVSPDGRTVNGAGGLQINAEKLENLGGIDTLLIVGDDNASNYDEFYTWLAGAHKHIAG